MGDEIKLLYGVAGGLLTFLGAWLLAKWSDDRKAKADRLAHDRKARADRESALRNTYADWLTSSQRVLRQLRAFDLLHDVMTTDESMIDSIVQEARQLQATLDDCFRDSNRSHLLDTLSARAEVHTLTTRMLGMISEKLLMIVGLIRMRLERCKRLKSLENAERWYRTNRENIDRVRDEVEKLLPDDMKGLTTEAQLTAARVEYADVVAEISPKIHRLSRELCAEVDAFEGKLTEMRELLPKTLALEDGV